MNTEFKPWQNNNYSRSTHRDICSMDCSTKYRQVIEY